MRHKRKLSDEEKKMIGGMAKVRLPHDKMAAIIGVSLETFDRMLKSDPALRDLIDKARANSSGKIRNTLYDMATDQSHKDQFNALKWWTQTQEGFKSADRVEITGLDGAPIEISKMTKEERLLAIKKLDEKLKLTEDE